MRYGACSIRRHKLLPSSEEEPEREIAGIFKENLEYPYNTFAKTKDLTELQWLSASDVVGFYFIAAELGDFETQYALYFQDENYPIIEKEQYYERSKCSSPKENGRHVQNNFVQGKRTR